MLLSCSLVSLLATEGVSGRTPKTLAAFIFVWFGVHVVCRVRLFPACYIDSAVPVNWPIT